MIVICDIDGTAADISHRKHFVEDRPKQWDKFNNAMTEDKPNTWCQILLEALSEHEIYFVTGRPETHRQQTEDWLKIHYNKSFTNPVYMRPAGNTEPDYVIKQRIFDEHFRDQRILFVIDDRKQSVDMWRKNSLVVLQCDEGDF